MVYWLIFSGILITDILTKYWARTSLCKVDTIALWKGVFHLTYVENTGAAFGIFRGKTLFLIILTVAVLAAVLFVVYKLRPKSRVLKTGVYFVAAGAVGNLIDRIYLGYVTDFFDFRLINFPVFNIADIFVCVGAALIVVFVMFLDDTSKKTAKEDTDYENHSQDPRQKA